MKNEGMHISECETTAMNSVVIPYELIKMIIDIAIIQDKRISSTLTQVSSNWRHSTLFHRFRILRTEKWSKYFRWIKESGIQFDISVYIKDLDYTYLHDISNYFTTLNLKSLSLDVPPNSFMNFEFEQRKFLTFIPSIKSVKKLKLYGKFPNLHPLSKTAFASLEEISLYDCEVPTLFWNELCAQATNIREINVHEISFSSKDHLDSIKSTNLDVIHIGKKVPCLMIDLILGDCECNELTFFDWHINKNASTNT